MVQFDPERDAKIANEIINGNFCNIINNSKIYGNDIIYMKKLGFKNIYEMRKYYKLYAWTNEILKKYYNSISLKNKTTLCVTSSADHILHAILAGSTHIDAFDINPLAKYYAMLKIAMVRTYDLHNLLNKYNETYTRHAQSLPLCLKNDIDLEEIKFLLSDEVLAFWKIIFEKNKNLDDLFRDDGYHYDISDYCAYFDDQKYNLLQKRLEKSLITYSDLDISKTEQYGLLPLDCYDAIFLSNISENYFNKSDDVLDNCSQLLKNGGVLYNYHCKSSITSSDKRCLKFKNLARANKSNNNVGVVMYQKSR